MPLSYKCLDGSAKQKTNHCFFCGYPILTSISIKFKPKIIAFNSSLSFPWSPVTTYPLFFENQNSQNLNKTLLLKRLYKKISQAPRNYTAVHNT